MVFNVNRLWLAIRNYEDTLEKQRRERERERKNGKEKKKRRKKEKKGKLHWGDAGTHETRGESVFFFEGTREGRGGGESLFFKDRLDGRVKHVATSRRLIRALSRGKGEVGRRGGSG